MKKIVRLVAVFTVGVFISGHASADSDFDDIFGGDGGVSGKASMSKNKGKSSKADSPEKYGKVATAFGWTIGGVPVYYGKITRKYKVLRKISEKRVQIAGPRYYDSFSGAAWMARQGRQVGADAVINYGSRRIAPKNFFLDTGYFEAWGTAVKFVK